MDRYDYLTVVEKHMLKNDVAYVEPCKGGAYRKVYYSDVQLQQRKKELNAMRAMQAYKKALALRHAG